MDERDYIAMNKELKTNSMKTAVEWLVEQMINQMGIRIQNTEIGIHLFDQAKEMEKRQIEEAYSNGRVDEQFKGTGASFYVTKAEQYYNEKFKS
jgi:hypothetical protein